MKLDFKDMMLYGLCIPAGIYAIYEGTNVYGYIQTLKKENPECY
jgi:hypothetical protein